MIPHLSERVLILAPQGRDAQVAAAMLKEADFNSVACGTIEELLREVEAGAGFGVITEEALRTADLHGLSRWILSQPEWSDFPFILLTVRGGGLERNPEARRYLETLGNVTFLERPFHPTTLISLAQSARRARRRQYDARSRLEELHTLATNLERRVEERTAERQTAIEQLHEAQKLETLGQLTGGVAHDFNNLLTPIVGALDLLQREFRETSTPKIDRWINNALQSAERAKTLVHRLLGFARRQELQTVPVDTASLLGGMRDLIASSIGRTIEVEMAHGRDVPRALADPNQLELAILNLCVNARDAMPDGGSLTLATESVSVDEGSQTKLPAGSYVRISVIDTGSGMDPETLARAVEPFFTTKEVGRGTGLGLSMVHGLAAQLGGALILRSVVGEGTSASLYLPFSEDGDGDGVEPIPVHDPVMIRSQSFCILVVDDEELVRKGTAEMLRALGHEIIEADGGAAALEVLADSPEVEMVVTDYKMPRMDGAELAKQVRARRPNLPMLLISGYTGAADPIAGLHRLDKPFGLGELADAIWTVHNGEQFTPSAITA